MGLFSRKDKSKATAKATAEDTTEDTAAETGRGAAKDEDVAEQARPTDAKDSDASTAASGSAASDATSDPDESTSSARESAVADEALGGDHLEDGPLDAADAPEEDRIDLGGLLVPMVEGMELRMEMDQRTRAVTGANLVIEGSSLQVQAFAAPKSRALWDEVRTSLRGSVVEQGGTAETRPGPFGTELIARLPVKRSDGRVGYRPARFIGVDGPRWMLRAILSGPALGDAEASRAFETLISRIVVVRGSDAMAPQELIPLNLPGQRPGLVPAEDTTLNPLERGPEITEIG